MVHTEAWICDWCGASYKSENACRDCEQKHQINGKIIRRWFLHIERYPSRLSIEFEDGVTVDYDICDCQHGAFERF